MNGSRSIDIPAPLNVFRKLEQKCGTQESAKCCEADAYCRGDSQEREDFNSWVWPLGRRWHVVGMSCNLGGQLLSQCWLWWRVAQHKTLWDWPSWIFGLASLWTTTLPLSLWFIFARCGGESKAASHKVGLLFWCHWLGAVGLMVAKATERLHFLEISQMYEMWMCVVYFVSVQAVCWRVAMAEDALDLRGCARHTTKMQLVGTLSFLFVPAEAYFALKKVHDGDIFMEKWRSLYTFSASILVGWLCWNRFSLMLRDIKNASRSLLRKRYLFSEAHWAAKCLRQVRLGLLMINTTSAFSSFLRLANAKASIKNGEWTNNWGDLVDVPSSLYCICEFVSLLLTVQCFHPHKPGVVSSNSLGSRVFDQVNRLNFARRRWGREDPPSDSDEAQSSSSEDQRAVGRRAATLEVWPLTSMERSDEWQDVVQNLASRYIEAGELLQFFSELPQVMPNFNCNRHTTNDVVRAAIIPGSVQVHTNCGESTLLGNAYVDRLRCWRVESVYAQRMVTHDWRNLFLHLVAAVLADALGQDEYAWVAHRLRSKLGVKKLQRCLRHHNRQFTRYWICAFCVNQHAGICGSFGPEPEPSSPEHRRYRANSTDTATGEPHQCCPCEETKHWSGDKCEMNKFDEMMALLHSEVPELCQVVAIDRKFDLFSRVWCVAEMVQASHSQIRQNVCLLSKELLDSEHGDLGIYLKLATLSVANCSAARAADKELILSKIEQRWGIEEFDARLQATIFGPYGLLGKEFLGFDVIYSAARVVERVKAFSANDEQKQL